MGGEEFMAGKKGEVSSKRVASMASKALSGKGTSSREKSLAGSVLTQRPNKKPKP